jgi:hypothetical protein
MQAAHDSKLLIDGISAPAVFHWDSQGRVSLPWEAKALDGLELPDLTLNFSFVGLSGTALLLDKLNFLS